MAFVKPDGQHKEVVVPAAPELSETPYAVKAGYVSKEEAEKAHPKKGSTNPWAK